MIYIALLFWVMVGIGVCMTDELQDSIAYNLRVYAITGKRAKWYRIGIYLIVVFIWPIKLGSKLE